MPPMISCKRAALGNCSTDGFLCFISAGSQVKFPSTVTPRLLFALLLGLSTAAAQKPAKQIDLGQFPADTIENVVVPVPSEIFAVLDRMGNPNWRAQLGTDKNYPASPNRAQVALLLGTVIADGFVAVEAEDSERVKEIGRNVLTLAEAINVRKSVVARSNSIIQKADARQWNAVRREFDGALQDVNQAMVELNDAQLAQLVSLGGWLRGTEVLTSIVKEKYSRDRAELLYQPLLVDYFNRQLDGMSPRLRSQPLVGEIRRSLGRIGPLIKKSPPDGITPETVSEINSLSTQMVGLIRAKGG
jgi:hypothetical protein